MEYEALISRILEAERSAREITREAREKQARLDADLEQETEKERQACFDWAEKRLAALRAETGEKKNALLWEQDERVAEALEKMEFAYRLYGDNWVDTLFRQTIDQTA